MANNMKFFQPQEVEVLIILPAIRRELSKEMKKQGMEQKKIAKLLCVTEAAVSQYVKNKRATKVEFTPDALDKIKKSAKKIKTKELMLTQTQHLLRYMKEIGITCKAHHDLADVPEKCVLCRKE